MSDEPSVDELLRRLVEARQDLDDAEDAATEAWEEWWAAREAVRAADGTAEMRRRSGSKAGMDGR